jgi:hypothetical protein
MFSSPIRSGGEVLAELSSKGLEDRSLFVREGQMEKGAQFFNGLFLNQERDGVAGENESSRLPLELYMLGYNRLD